MAAIELDHYSHNTRAWLVQHLAGARYRFRVATGFFSVAGYDLIRSHLGHLKVDILVGYDEHSHERLKAKLIDDIIAHLSRWDTDNRRLAVISLVGKLERRELQVHEQLETRIRARDHAKMYLIDDRLALNGSANLTRNGLIHNAESVSAVIEPDRVGWLSARFEEYWTAPDTQDLTQSLLNALQRWLELRSPYDVYLKTVNALVPEDQSAPPRASYKKPTEYQQVVIERSLRQLRQWRGSFIVASTGLGKTIMATHIAFRMHREGIVLNALIFAPKPIRKEWSEAFRIAGVSAQDFTRNNLDQMVRGKRADGEIRQIEDALSQVDERTLIILDETQYFVNRLRASEKSESTRSNKRLIAADRRSFERLMRVVNGQNPYILLLTATPLVKDVNDLNTQLLLLPHAAPSDQPDQLGRHRIRFPGDESEGKPWTVETRGDHFNAFMELPVVTVISTSYVAKTYAVHTELGDYVEFPEEIRWIPKIEIHRVRVPLPFESAIAEALDAKLFRHVLVRFMSRGTWQRSETTIENLVTVSWASSPAELARTLRRVLNEYEAKVRFKFDHAHRESILKPIIDALDQLPVERDLKLMRLRDIVEDSVREGRKVIVYSERLATCLYLEQSLRVLLPEVRIGNVVQINRKGELDLKEDYDVDQMIMDFAPEANQGKLSEDRLPNPIDVLISTDAYGVGVNLQDASVVVDYDLSWTPDTLVQRAGRVLRFWKEPRTVRFFIFTGEFRQYAQGKDASLKVEARLRTLTERGRKAEQYTEMPVLPESETAAFESLAELSSVENLGTATLEQFEEFSGVTHFLQHTTELKKNLNYFKTIPDDISSARMYDGEHDLIYVLLRYRAEYGWIVVDLKTHRERVLTEDPLLDLLACSQDAEVAAVPRDRIEILAQKCRMAWAEKRQIADPDEVERICALYLVGKESSDDPEHLLWSAVTTQSLAPPGVNPSFARFLPGFSFGGRRWRYRRRLHGSVKPEGTSRPLARGPGLPPLHPPP